MIKWFITDSANIVYIATISIEGIYDSSTLVKYDVVICDKGDKNKVGEGEDSFVDVDIDIDLDQSEFQWFHSSGFLVVPQCIITENIIHSGHRTGSK